MPVDYSSDTADPSPQRCSDSSDVIVVPDVVVGGDGGGSDHEGGGAGVDVEQGNQQAVLSQDGRGEGCVWDESSPDDKDETKSEE